MLYFIYMFLAYLLFQEFLNEVFENEQNHFNNNNLLLEFENRQSLHKPREAQCPVVTSIEQSFTMSNLKKNPVPCLNLEDSSPTHIRKIMTTYEQGKVELKIYL